MLELEPSFAFVLDFLADPTFNLAQTDNFLSALSYSERRIKTEEEFDLYSGFCQQALRLGILPDEAIYNLICRLPTITTFDPCQKAAYARSLAFYRMVWKSITECSVFTVPDLSGRTLNALLCHVSVSPFTPETRSFGIEIISKMSVPQLSASATGFTQFMRLWIREWRDHKALPSSEASQMQPIPHLAQFLDCLDASIANRLLIATMRSIQLDTKKNDSLTWIPRRQMYPLIAAIKQSLIVGQADEVWHQIGETLVAAKSYKLVAPYLSKLPAKDTCDFFLRHWVKEDLHKSTKKSSALVLEEIQQSYDHFFSVRENVNPYALMMFAMRQHEPNSSRFLHPLFRLLRSAGKQRAVIETINDLLKLGWHVSSKIVSHELNTIGGSEPLLALKLNHTYLRAGLEHSPQFVVAMVEHPDIPTWKVLDLLFRQPVSPNKDKMASLLGEVALAFARSEHLTPRAAFQNAMRCYRHLRCKYNLQPDSQMTRAMTLAGVTRYLLAGKWVSTVKLVRILQEVRKVEGEDVAQNLDELVYHWRSFIVSEMQKNGNKSWRER
jgi:hypothetical protein